MTATDESAELGPEEIRVVRHPALHGLELLRVENSAREFKVFNAVHSLAVSESWLGHVHYRNRPNEVVPGTVFCAEPGETHATRRAGVGGAFRVLLMDEAPLRQQLEQLDFFASSIRFTEIVTPRTAAELRRVCNLLQGAACSPLEVQSAFVDLIAVAARQLIAGAPNGGANEEDASRKSCPMRDLLHAAVAEGSSVSLDELAAAAKLSRFRALRAFKSRHGVPPHAYELCLRLSRARELMKQGARPAAAAMECGFADQSHMTRHFRSLCGFTPAQYAVSTSRASRGASIAPRTRRSEVDAR